MCGACGRPVAADPVFPEGRTTRGNLIAAQMIAGLCPPLAGRVKVVGLADGFVVSTPGRPQALCTTVGEAWTAVFTAAPTAIALLETIPDEFEARYRDQIEHKRLEAIISAGRDVARALTGERVRTSLPPHRPPQP